MNPGICHFDGHRQMDTHIYKCVQCPKCQCLFGRKFNIDNQIITNIVVQFVHMLTTLLSESDKMILSKEQAADHVSIFSDVLHSQKPIGSLNLLRVLQSKKNKDRILYLRTLEKGSKEFQYLKKSLPCFTPSGLFLQRNKEGLLKHSGFLCIEWDNLDHNIIKDILRNCDFIYYAGLSCSGKGIFALVRIADPTQHGEYFKALRTYFDEKQIPIDPSGSDVTRLRVVSYDPEPIFNADSTVWNKTLPPLYSTPTYTIKDTDIQQRMFLCGLDYIQHHSIDITAGRNNWLAIGSMVKTFFGDDGEDYYVVLSQYHPDFSEWECRSTYRSLRTGNYGLGVFCSACTRAGVPKLTALYSK